jgi:predicted alpha/beta superfamily hydrolase
MTLLSATHAPLSPNTVYFEMDSSHVADRFGVWVTTPPGYERRADQHYPVVYVTDGNTNALLAVAASFLLLGDHLRPVRPFLQVCIGYTDNDVSRRWIRRNRDFIPPGEPVPARLERHVRQPAYSNALGEGGLEAFLANARNGGADRFLAFLEEELHPEIMRRCRVDPTQAGLYGHSQGGLFTLYALTTGSRLFSVFGAGSPGIVAEDSRIWALYDELVTKAGRERRELRLHLLANEQEMTGPVELYRAIGANYLRFIDMAQRNPLPGLRLTSAIVHGENHFSGVFDAYRSFLRACYAL